MEELGVCVGGGGVEPFNLSICSQTLYHRAAPLPGRGAGVQTGERVKTLAHDPTSVAASERAARRRPTLLISICVSLSFRLYLCTSPFSWWL